MFNIFNRVSSLENCRHNLWQNVHNIWNTINNHLWPRLSKLETNVYGHNGEQEPPQEKPVYERLRNLERDVYGQYNDWGLYQHVMGTGQPGQEGLWRVIDTLQEEVQRLNQQVNELNAKLQKQGNLEKVLIEAVNKQLGEKEL